MKQKILLLPITLLLILCTQNSNLWAQVPSDTIHAHVWDSLAIKRLDYPFSALGARPLLDSLKIVRSKYPGTDSIPYANWLYQEARYCYYNSEPAQGVALMLEVIRLRKNSGKYAPDSHPMAAAENMLGLLLSNVGRHDLALAHHRYALHIRESIAQRGGAFNFKNMVAYSYAGIGQELGYLGESDQSIAFILRALPEIRDSAKNHPLEMRGFVANLYANLAGNYLNTRDHALAEYYFREAVKLMGSNFGKDNALGSDQLAQIWINRGTNYALQLKIDSSGLCFEKAEQILGRIGQTSGTQLAVASMRQTQGILSLNSGNYEQAKRQFREALRSFESIVGEKHFSISGLYFNLGIGFFFQNQPDSAIVCARLAEQALGENPAEKSFLDFAKSKSLAGRAWVQKYQNQPKKDTHFLEQAIAEAKVVETAFDHYVSSLEGELRFFNMAAGMKQAFEPALAAHFLLYRLDSQQVHLMEAFRLSEKTKALGWLEKFRFQHNFKDGDSLLVTDQQLRKELADLTTQRYSITAQNGDVVTAEADVIDKKLFELERRREDYLQNLKKNNTALSNALYSIQIAETATIQQNLADKEVLLSYFIGDSSVFLFGMTNHTLRMEMLTRTILRSSTQRLLESLRPLGTPTNTALETYITESRYLYSKLIKPLKPLLKEGARIIVIPDGVLCGLPFEVLFEKGKSEDYPNFDYILKHYSFRYAYSATALLEMENKKHHTLPTKLFLGVAPVFPGGHTGVQAPILHEGPRNFEMDSLKYNIPEVRNVLKIMGKGDTLIGREATKRAFLAQADRYEAILLSTHGQFNDYVVEYSFVAFSESPLGNKGSRALLMPEVEAMTLNCDLLALGACQTALGRLRNGEGVISLTRMFAFAGAKSLLSTLWDISDGVSQELMEAFFNNLKAGQTKDRALQAAKVHYIKKQTTDLRKYPSYWASFILIGDDSPLLFDKP